MDVAPFGAERSVLMLVENCIGGKELDQCKAGFTWKYVVKEKSTNGGRQTVVTGETVYKSASGITFGMSYPFDSGRREDKTVDSIREAMHNLRAFACEVNVLVREYGSQTIVGQGLGGKVVQDFIADLARINRVLVVMDETVTK